MTDWCEVVAVLARVWMACGIAVAVCAVAGGVLAALWLFPWWLSLLLQFVLLLPIAMHFAERR